MEENLTQEQSIYQIIILAVWCAGVATAAFKLAKDKGRNALLWGFLGLIPLVNLVCMMYFVGTPKDPVK